MKFTTRSSATVATSFAISFAGIFVTASPAPAPQDTTTSGTYPDTPYPCYQPFPGFSGSDNCSTTGTPPSTPPTSPDPGTTTPPPTTVEPLTCTSEVYLDTETEVTTTSTCGQEATYGDCESVTYSNSTYSITYDCDTDGTPTTTPPVTVEPLTCTSEVYLDTSTEVTTTTGCGLEATYGDCESLTYSNSTYSITYYCDADGTPSDTPPVTVEPLTCTSEEYLDLETEVITTTTCGLEVTYGECESVTYSNSTVSITYNCDADGTPTTVLD